MGPLLLTMLHAVAWESLHRSSTTACCRAWGSDASSSRPEFFSGKSDLRLNKFVRIRMPSINNAATRGSSEASADSQRGYTNAFCDQPCALSCPVDRGTNMQRWVEEAVHDIVKNIQEAPFLQYVFDSKGRLGTSQRQKISQDVFDNAEYWPPILESLSKAAPDGVILVQKLEPGCSSTSCLAEAFQWADDEEMVCPLLPYQRAAETNVWGVLVQARAVHANACYLLKTTRVPSSAGICTRYCLTRAKCFGPSHFEQLEKAWLL